LSCEHEQLVRKIRLDLLTPCSRVKVIAPGKPGSMEREEEFQEQGGGEQTEEGAPGGTDSDDSSSGGGDEGGDAGDNG
jgi:hypothetical protein